VRRLLWIGDAGCDSGFARCTHHTLEVLRRGWDVSVLGLNYRGDPHGYPYPIFPAAIGGDFFGVRRLPEMLTKVQPEMIVIQNDPWNIPAYVSELKGRYTGKIVGAVAVDGKNCRGDALNGLTRAIFWTQFAQHEALLGGMTIPSGVVGLGVDLSIYKPASRTAARHAVGLPGVPDNAFIVGNVNRNQPRKRLDLTIAYVGEWVRMRGLRDVFLFLHVAPTGDHGYDCEQLACYHNLRGRLIFSEPEVWKGLAEEDLALTYQTFDVQLSTSQGEGWGLCTMEGMACGIPQIVPDWSALGEWPGDAVMKVPCPTSITTPGRINSIGGVADMTAVIAALDTMYDSHHGQVWARYRQRGLGTVREDRFRWENVGLAFAEELDKCYGDVQGTAVADGEGDAGQARPAEAITAD
jgi:D-inositol-3-phosphate glycosyltransferase